MPCWMRLLLLLFLLLLLLLFQIHILPLRHSRLEQTDNEIMLSIRIMGRPLSRKTRLKQF